MKVHKSEYSDRVDAWLNAHGIQRHIERTGEVQGFTGEKVENGKPLLWHDTYRATFLRGNEELTVPTFHQSAAHSASAIRRAKCRCQPYVVVYNHKRECARNLDQVESPSAYDLLSAITKSDPGTFADFCSEFGYDEDSRRAMDTYLTVQREWESVRRFFTADELNELQEIAS